MLTAETIIGKVTVFICQKAALSIAKLPFDKRKKACRSLTKLYYCIQALDDVTESIFQTASSFRPSASGEAFVVMNALNNHMHEVALASNMFIDLGNELYAGLKIIDPVLAECCEALYVSKGGFLTEMSRAIAWDRSSDKACIVIKLPRWNIEATALESSYAATSASFDLDGKTYWPDTWSPSEEPSDVTLTWEDNTSAELFIQRLAQHRAVLVDAKEKLRQLLKDSFSVEELLFQTDSHPYR